MTSSTVTRPVSPGPAASRAYTLVELVGRHGVLGGVAGGHRLRGLLRRLGGLTGLLRLPLRGVEAGVALLVDLLAEPVEDLVSTCHVSALLEALGATTRSWAWRLSPTVSERTPPVGSRARAKDPRPDRDAQVAQRASPSRPVGAGGAGGAAYWPRAPVAQLAEAGDLKSPRVRVRVPPGVRSAQGPWPSSSAPDWRDLPHDLVTECPRLERGGQGGRRGGID